MPPRLLPLPLLALVAVCAACSGAPTNAPSELVALGNARNTATAQAVSTQAAHLPTIESANERAFNVSLTEAALPPQLTRLANDNQSTAIANDLFAQRATSEALDRASSVTATVAALKVLESDTQKRIAENNAAIADATNGANTRRDVMTWGAGICLFAFGVFMIWCVIQAGIYLHNTRKDKEKSDKWKRIFEAEKLMLAAGVAQTSAGPTSYAVTIAEKHVADYSKRLSRDDQVRAALKNYISAGVDLARQGVKFPYSRANACKHLLVTHPATGDWWQLGHERTVKILRAMKVLDNTGAGGETVLIVEVGDYARVIDLTPLPDLPFDPIPAVKITVAGWQLSQV